mmetsp:Transcript_24285/g.61548  ORF Transcript_24285/g.61548 Transcript_24285/m.61548 type:complete len:324 (+) Transcript_24285:303-1274(+)
MNSSSSAEDSSSDESRAFRLALRPPPFLPEAALPPDPRLPPVGVRRAVLFALDGVVARTRLAVVLAAGLGCSGSSSSSSSRISPSSSSRHSSNCSSVWSASCRSVGAARPLPSAALVSPGFPSPTLPLPFPRDAAAPLPLAGEGAGFLRGSGSPVESGCPVESGRGSPPANQSCTSVRSSSARTPVIRSARLREASGACVEYARSFAGERLYANLRCARRRARQTSAAASFASSCSLRGFALDGSLSCAPRASASAAARSPSVRSATAAACRASSSLPSGRRAVAAAHQPRKLSRCESTSSLPQKPRSSADINSLRGVVPNAT